VARPCPVRNPSKSILDNYKSIGSRSVASIITCYLSGESIASQMSSSSSSGQLDIVEIILIESQMYHVQS
jgi:hypothetical protein